jgi:putative transposase
MSKSHYSIKELLTYSVPTLPNSFKGLLVKIERECWAFVEVKAKGGPGGVRREYQPPAAVMAAIKQVLLEQALKAAPEPEASPSVAAVIPSSASPLPSAGVSVPPTGAMTVATQADAGVLKDWQKKTAEARAAILREVDRLAAFVSKEKAISKVVSMADDGTLPPHLMQLVPVANARAGGNGKRTLSRRTIYDWFNALKKGGSVNALAPKDQHAVAKVPVWAGDLLAHFQRPQKPSLTWAVEQIAQAHALDAQRLYHRARRFLEKMGNVELEAGRRGPRDLKNIKPFIRRDSSVLWPADVYSADGHTFDAEVAHPAHGKAFRPEITSVRDIATRRLVGWSVDLAESGLAVLDAMRHAIETGGVCNLFYVDHGSGFDNALQSAPGIGMESRLGYTKTHSLPYNSQARGVVEKGHRDIWVRAAKELPTYMGADMDAEAKNKVFKITRKDIKISGTSRRLMPWTQFLEFVREHADRYNNRPHRSLKKIYDAALGRQRHMTPNEAWAEGVAEGAELVMITPDESRELFRPMKECKVLRGELRLFNNRYFSHDLTE